MVKALDGFALDRKIRTAGWNFFFMAAEIRLTPHHRIVAAAAPGSTERQVVERLRATRYIKVRTSIARAIAKTGSMTFQKLRTNGDLPNPPIIHCRNGWPKTLSATATSHAPIDTE